GDDDDCNREEAGPLDFVGGGADLLHHRGPLIVAMRQQADDVLHHDDGAFDDHPEVERAERQQVGGNVAQVEADRRKQQRERNGEGDDQRAADVAEKEEQDHRHQDDAFGEVVHHRMRGEVEQIAAIQVWHDPDAGRQQVVVQLLDFRVDRVERRIGVGALSHQHDAGDHVVVVEDVPVEAMYRLPELTEPDLRSLVDGRDVPDAKSGAVLGGEHGSLNVVHRAHLTGGAKVDWWQSGFDEAPAAVDVVVRQLLLDLAQGEAIGDQPVRVDAHLIFAGRPAEARHADDVRHRLELLL